MKALRVNAPVAAATERLERFAQLGTELALAEVARGEALAAANAAADRITVPIATEMDAIRAEIEPWWQRNGAALLPGKRKTVELGGCIIGSKAGTSSLTFALGDDQLAAKTLAENRWSKGYVQVKLAVDKAAVKSNLAGKDGDKLRALGFGVSNPGEAFILKRSEQEGTVGRSA